MMLFMFQFMSALKSLCLIRSASDSDSPARSTRFEYVGIRSLIGKRGNT